MDNKLDLQELLSRSRNHSKDNYLFIYSVMKGATVANAAYTIAIFVTIGLPSLLRVPFWLVSFAGLILTYNATIVGTLIMGFIPSWRDIVLPFTLAIFEFLLFSILRGTLSQQLGPEEHRRVAVCSTPVHQEWRRTRR